MKFEEYHIAEGIKKSIAKQGFKKPTDIQFKSIPAILNGEDVLAIAQTGTGKTAAFVIPIIHKIHIKKLIKQSNGVKCLVMAPTHELALQIDTVFRNLSNQTKVISYCVHGGVDRDPQIEKLEDGVDVVIATPGRLFDLAKRQVLDLRNIEILVLDEADHMLDLGFIEDIKMLMRFIPKDRQTLFFSATIDEKIKKLAYAMIDKKSAIRIQISPKDPVAKNIEHAVAFIEMDDKRFFLANFIANHPQQKILVFVRTKVRAERVKKALAREEVKAETLHGDKLQSERDEAMRAFRQGDNLILIATDISARGIDIPNVEYVINYDLPESSEHYIHRVGRTGRGTNKGQALSFCSTEELTLLAELDRDLGKPIMRLELSKGDYALTIEEQKEALKTDWQSLIAAEEESFNKKRKKKKR
ncbi:MAG: ATP-dependent helicase [Bacteroidetes bacterium]|nr:MAG: ATP-dependent helicase [Bacteroidota bacterium]MBL1145232.1 DEAD/DEAH box helicase [Bacteroidota bacterium]NOG58028.1 DEAD/DEAH box helicase [Bacteroidota bacterium]